MQWKGIGAAPGYAIGPAFLLLEEKIEVQKRTIPQAEIEREVKRFSDHTSLAIEELEALRESTRQKMGEKQAEIFSAHILLLQDPEFIGAIEAKIRTEAVNAEAALQEVADSFIALFDSMDDEYMRERAADIRDIRNRLLRKLTGAKTASLDDFNEPVILLAHDLTPSDTAQLDRSKVSAFATDIGGRTSHSAIMARSMDIPAVVGLKEITANVKPGDILILDGSEGLVYVNPSPDLVAAYKAKAERESAQKVLLQQLKDEPSVTADGARVELVANIGNPQDAVLAKEYGAEGVGLYRTEFLYMGRSALPTEDEQFQAYKAVAETFGGTQPVVIRTLDIGGDKELPYLNLPKEMNPFLGYRAIRLCLDRTEMFKTQLRAILRASAFGNIKMMYPMISSLHELRQANQLLAEVKEELAREGIAYNPTMEVGIMIEIPSAAMIADQLVKEVDFFSIGTNDLIQYTIAVDRMNEKISHLYQPFHPAVLRLIQHVIQAAHSAGKWVGMCGEMAGNLTAIPLLLGMGLDEFSMSASSILRARHLVKQLDKGRMKEIARHVMTLDSSEAIVAYLQEHVMDKL
ncbi:phosphoenolpyruvate--protein phosphotransferase [Brevibacillus sp. SYP-B805]|uniref:phosphoenolpyruvate--protein phosphotransferase n=1 Tax=Brevibacillus sp. SYP-B805 TaxID=1578199 RepID=UPI0013EC5ED7|nr:phosphoenolpyruvate--protein phosphotransferase [Brevibacillus sp. SYP-B805]NGQ95258.1 phosphoenolpyruvate--protein phosphotransferase [Brevibacillus sp. SYP-B805]